jgi:hypothetical protein
MKRQKKKLALPRRQWKISPVTRVKGSATQYSRRQAKEAARQYDS